MQISDNELWVLSYYRESELAGGLIMGRLARETDDDELRVHLTQHCAEETMHAWLWTQTILEVGGLPRKVAETYQTRYLAAVGPTLSLVEVLALTNVFEKRVVRHFRAHLRQPGTHPAIARTLQRMIDEEAGHLSWVKERLDRYTREKGDAVVTETLRRFAEIDRRVYTEVLAYRDRLGELLGPLATAESAHGSNGNGERVEHELRRLIARTTGDAARPIEQGTRLRDLGVDSLDLAVFLMSVEETFEVEIEPGALERVRTFGELVTYVRNRTTAAG